MNRITAFAQVYNEESRIDQFICNFIWVDELVIFNKSSKDKTKEIALSYGKNVKVIDVPYDDGSDGLKDWITNYNSNEWVLIITASDLIDPELANLIKIYIQAEGNDFGLVYLPFKVYSLGITSKFSPFDTRYKPLLFRKDSLNLSSKLHYELAVKPNTKSYTLRSNEYYIYHFTNNNPQQTLEKILRYTKVEAEQMISAYGKYRALSKSFSHLFKAILTGLFKKKIIFGGVDTLILWLLHLSYFVTRIIIVWDLGKNESSEIAVNRMRKEVTESWTAIIKR